MPVTLTASQVREAMLRANGFSFAGNGSVSSAAVGTLFHRVLAGLLSHESPCSMEAALRDLDPDLPLWQQTLKRHTYDHLVGPLLTQQAASLQSHGRQVLDLWQATQGACDWLAGLWWEFTKQGTQAIRQQDWCASEKSLLCELRRPDWQDSVTLVGQADALLMIPQKNLNCLLEWKLGKTNPEVDLGQACLYHLMLHGDTEHRRDSTLAVVSFKPELEESYFESRHLVEAQARLIELIGSLAGVVKPPAAPTKPTNGRGMTTRHDPLKAQRPGASAMIRSEMTAAAPSWILQLQDSTLRVLRSFGVPCRVLKPPVVGPAFARMFVFPERGITNSRVLSQADQLHLHLALSGRPLMSVVEGAIGIDVPRPDRESIPFSGLLPLLNSSNDEMGSSRIPVGVDLNGNWTWCDIAASESAHLLVVGTSGSGKSQWLRTALAALMVTNTPATLELVVIDPKMNSFTFLRGSPFLRRPVVISLDETVETLNDLVEEMERRYMALAHSNSQSLTQHIAVTGEPMTRLVCLCDEYADLLSGAKSKAEKTQIEELFKRLAQKGRAAGVHLILATQQPRANIITTAIRANLPAKVALRVSDAKESRIAFEENGAECLLDKGDLYYKCIGRPIRLQSAWLPTEEEPLAGTRAVEAETVSTS